MENYTSWRRLITMFIHGTSKNFDSIRRCDSFGEYPVGRKTKLSNR